MFNIDKDILKIYRNYTYERANIFYKKEILKEPSPWTEDYYLKTFKYTNIRRELDRESKFLIETVINNSKLCMANKALNCALFRCINHSEGTKYLKEWPVDFTTYDKNEYKVYEDSADNSNRLQSNAYFLSHVRYAANILTPELKGYNCNLVEFINQNREQILLAFFNRESAESVCDLLSKVKSIGGPFMRYQIFIDWTYIPEYWFNEDEYVISGPGCNNGIDWMLAGTNLIKYSNDKTILDYGYLTNQYKNKTYEDFLYWFRDNLPNIMNTVGLEWNPAKFQHFLPVRQQNWSLMQIENSFCELNKLLKLRNNINMRVRYYGDN